MESTSREHHAQNRYVAPDFKRRQLIFDSFAKLKRNKIRGNRGEDESSGTKGTLLYTWGAGYHGQLGLSSYRKKCKLLPANIEFKEPVVQVACGGFHSAVVTESGRVYTWGDGRMGQLGNLARKHNMHATPRLVDRLAAYDVHVAQIACGQYHTVCISDKGDLYSWGSGKYGQLGHATRLDERYPRRIEMDSSIGPIIQVACGDRHTAAVTKSRKVATFGSGQHGQLGHGNGNDYLKPKIVEVLEHMVIVEVSCGSTASTMITDDGALYLCGFGESIHPKEMSNIVDIPRLVPFKDKVVQVACGQSHILVLTEPGDVYAFGNGGMGQLGHGARSNCRFPRLVLKGKEIQEICTGRYHSMAVSAYGVLYSWGCGESGQLAHNSLENEYFPRIVTAILPNVIGQICCGEHHSFALCSIEHSSISQDVLNWKLVEDEELKLKKNLLKEFPNGLKSSSILQVEQERKRIVAEITEGLKREKQVEEQHLKEQLESIHKRDAILREVNEAQNKTKPLQESITDGTPSASGANESSQAGSGATSSTAFTANASQIAAAASIISGDLAVPSNMPSAVAASASTTAQVAPATNSSAGAANSVALNVNGAPRRSSFRQMLPSKSTPAIKSQKLTKKTEPIVVPGEISLSESTESLHGDGGGNRGFTENAARRAVAKATSPDMRALNLSDPWSKAGANFSHGNNAPTGPTSNAVVVSTANNGNINGGSIQQTLNSAHPLSQRVAFLERTTNSLSRVKNLLASELFEEYAYQETDLLTCKGQFNQLCEIAKAKSKYLEDLRNAYVFMRPTEEDLGRSASHEKRIKELNMKLVTLNTRLMEADENKKNYELYIIRMKEEDVQLSKQIDHLRHLVVEYDRLLTKMDKMNGRVMHQRGEVHDEISKFHGDVVEFHSFAVSQLKKYSKFIKKKLRDTQRQQESAIEREVRKEERRNQRLLRLQLEYDNATEESGEIKEELDTWLEKVQFYEQRFHKITAATGLSRPEDIINKFFFNDEITSNLNREIKQREHDLTRLKNEETQLSEKISQMKGSFVSSSWRDIDSLKDQFQEKDMHLSNEMKEFDRVMQKLVLVEEGVVTLISRINKYLPSQGNEKPPERSSQSLQSFVAWITILDKRINVVMDVVQQYRKRKIVANTKYNKRIVSRMSNSPRSNFSDPEQVNSLPAIVSPSNRTASLIQPQQS